MSWCNPYLVALHFWPFQLDFFYCSLLFCKGIDFCIPFISRSPIPRVSDCAFTKRRYQKCYISFTVLCSNCKVWLYSTAPLLRHLYNVPVFVHVRKRPWRFNEMITLCMHSYMRSRDKRCRYVIKSNEYFVSCRSKVSTELHLLLSLCIHMRKNYSLLLLLSRRSSDFPWFRIWRNRGHLHQLAPFRVRNALCEVFFWLCTCVLFGKYNVSLSNLPHFVIHHQITTLIHSLHNCVCVYVCVCVCVCGVCV